MWGMKRYFKPGQGLQSCYALWQEKYESEYKKFVNPEDANINFTSQALHVTSNCWIDFILLNDRT